MNIDQAEAARLHERAQRDLDEVSVQFERLTQQRTGLQQFVRGLELMYPALQAPQASEAPKDAGGPAEKAVDPVELSDTSRVRRRKGTATASTLVLDLINGNAGQWLSARQVHDEFLAQEWDATITAVRLALKRHAERGLIQVQTRDDRLVYSALTNAESPAVGAGLSVVSDQSQEGGDSTHEQRDLNDHRDYQTRWNGDRDRGASVGG